MANLLKEDGNLIIEQSTGDGGGWVIVCLENQEVPQFEVYEIPMYGGKRMYDKAFHCIVSAFDHTKTYV